MIYDEIIFIFASQSSQIKKQDTEKIVIKTQTNSTAELSTKMKVCHSYEREINLGKMIRNYHINDLIPRINGYRFLH